MIGTIRQTVTTGIRSDWATIPALQSLRVTDTERSIGEIRKPIALVRQKTIGKDPSAPLSHRRVGFLLTIISPLADADRASDELEPFVWAALDYLDPRYLHEEAEVVGWRVSDSLSYLAYDIPFTVIASKEN